jgi:hypothetical protein
MKTAVALILLALSRTAAAGDLVLDRTCIEIDASTDQLAEPDRERSAVLLRRVLERAHQLVVTAGCTETFVLSHERTGDAYVIRMRSSTGKRRMTTPALDELTPKYDKMVASLLAAKPALAEAATEAPPLLDAQPAAAELQPQIEALPTRDTSEPGAEDEQPRKDRNLAYITAGGQLTGGPAVSIGYRRAWSKVALDIAYSGRTSQDSVRASLASIELLRTTDWTPTVQAYFGGGLSFGAIKRGREYYENYDYYWGEGIHGELTAGLRISGALDVLAQLDVTLPFYEIGNAFGGKDYAPMAVISGGIGF